MLWMAGMAGMAGAGLLGCRAGDSPASSAAPRPSPVATRSAAAPDPGKLAGRWLRSDSDYVIEIVRVGPNGFLEAKYFNPNPIHVSRAAWKSDGEHVGVAIELTDRNYPGNYYTLVYDPGSDALLGTYHHLGVNETYEVAFSRLANDPGRPVKP